MQCGEDSFYWRRRRANSGCSGSRDEIGLQHPMRLVNRFDNRTTGLIAATLLTLGFLASAGSLPSIQAADPQHSSILGKSVPLPDGMAEIQSPATARILAPRERPYTVGDQVKKGDPLAIIEHRYNLHDASHLSTGRWELLRDMLDAREAAVDAK